MIKSKKLNALLVFILVFTIFNPVLQVNADAPVYTVDSYSDDSYKTPKDDFVQNEWVYGKGNSSRDYYLRIEYYNPSDTFMGYCNSTNAVREITCDYTIPNDAPTGKWKITFAAKPTAEASWNAKDVKDTAYFNVTAGEAGNILPVGYAHTQLPCSVIGNDGDSFDSYGWVYVESETEGSGQGAGIKGQAGYGPVDTDPETDLAQWTWSNDATYLSDKDGLTPGDLIYDEYKATLVLVEGLWDYGWRFSGDGGATWTYADLGPECGGNGTTDGWDLPGSLEVSATQTICGNGIVDSGEQCDDGNNNDGDGCSASCILETNYECEDVTNQNGWYAQYYNYSRNHPDMNLNSSLWPDAGHGDPLGTWDTDWYTEQYFKFYRIDNDLNFGSNFFPFDMAPEEIDNGHEYHFGVHWRAKITTDNPGNYNVTLRSDDDAWVYVDGVLVIENSGIHPASTKTGTLNLTGSNIVDIFFAERHVTGSEMFFVFDNPGGLTITPMPESCEHQKITIYAQKIVCENETDLPNWNGENITITATTAQDYIDSHPNCHFEENWDFQWGINNVSDPGKSFYGYAENGWNTFTNPTGNGIPASVIITDQNINEGTTIKLREVLKAGYIPFSYSDSEGGAPGSDVSAEFWCHNDVLNYDNYDWIRNSSWGEEYHCVAFNVLEDSKNNICGVKFFDVDKDGINNNDDYNIVDWSISLWPKRECTQGEEWADEVIEYIEGDNVPSNRNNPLKALGVAENNDTMNFVSLGFGGTLILKFDNFIENGPGDDIQVIETTYGSPSCETYPEYVRVYASQDGNTWTDLGTKCQEGNPSFDLGPLAWAQYIKLVDETTPMENRDGFDVDGVKALHCLATDTQAQVTNLTTENGYCFENLEPNYYYICEETRQDWFNTTPVCHQILVEEGQEYIIDFGNYTNQDDLDDCTAQNYSQPEVWSDCIDGEQEGIGNKTGECNGPDTWTFTQSCSIIPPIIPGSNIGSTILPVFLNNPVQEIIPQVLGEKINDFIKYIKSSNITTVYLLDEYNVRNPYPHYHVWESYFGKNYSFVEILAQENILQYILGKNILFKVGTLMKIPSISKVYKVGEEGILNWIKTEEKAKELYGDNWSKLIYDLPEAFFGDYTIGEDIE